MTKNSKDVFNILYKHIYETYDLPYTNPKSNWFKDLGLSKYEFDVFCEWIDQKFDIKLPRIPYKNLDELSQQIVVSISQKPSLFARIKQRFQRTR